MPQKKSDVDKNLDSLSASFRAHIQRARAWARSDEAKRRLDTADKDDDLAFFKDATWKPAESCKYITLTGSVSQLAGLLRAREYSLLVADIPRGIIKDKCQDTKLSDYEMEAMVLSFRQATTAPNWKVIIMHGLEDYAMVRGVLNSACGGGVDTCFWHKTNIMPADKDRLYDAMDCISIGHHSRDESHPELFVSNRSNPELRGKPGLTNVFTCPAVYSKGYFEAYDNLPGCVYQKPLKLMRQLIRLFSEEGSWVVDACAGSGSTSLAALKEKRPVVAIDVDQRCTRFIRHRLTSSSAFPDEDEELGTKKVSSFRGFHKEVVEKTAWKSAGLVGVQALWMQAFPYREREETINLRSPPRVIGETSCGTTRVEPAVDAEDEGAQGLVQEDLLFESGWPRSGHPDLGQPSHDQGHAIARTLDQIEVPSFRLSTPEDVETVQLPGIIGIRNITSAAGPPTSREILVAQDSDEPTELYIPPNFVNVAREVDEDSQVPEQ